ncbi:MULTISPECIES: hypothetical protein [Pseudomonas]|uniref:hypothetical protein n=1 Tax=Pseudomonas TaxID=286 RepID=UPI0006980127|nr:MULTISPECIES: hypothetical protein [Pseudomonas]
MTSNERHVANTQRTPQARSSGLVANELIQWLGDWYFAWCWRRKMRRLLRLESVGQVRLGSAQERVSAGAQMPLATIAARQAEWRRKGDVAG